MCATRGSAGTRRRPSTCHRSCGPSAKQRSAEPSEGARRRDAEWIPTRLLHDAAAVGPATLALVERILAAKPHPEQGFRACLGILRRVRSDGPERLEAACQRGMDGTHRASAMGPGIGAKTYGSVQSIPRNGLDRAHRADTVPDELSVQHGNIRGSGYDH